MANITEPKNIRVTVPTKGSHVGDPELLESREDELYEEPDDPEEEPDERETELDWLDPLLLEDESPE